MAKLFKVARPFYTSVGLVHLIFYVFEFRTF